MEDKRCDKCDLYMSIDAMFYAGMCGAKFFLVCGLGILVWRIACS